MISHRQAQLQEYKRGYIFNCILGLRSQPLQVTTHIVQKIQNAWNVYVCKDVKKYLI
jgi:hypothetical protein